MAAKTFPGFPRVVADDHTRFGKARITGTRICVSDILEQLALTQLSVSDAYSHISEEDVRQALRYAAVVIDESTPTPDSVKG